MRQKNFAPKEEPKEATRLYYYMGHLAGALSLNNVIVYVPKIDNESNKIYYIFYEVTAKRGNDEYNFSISGITPYDAAINAINKMSRNRVFEISSSRLEMILDLKGNKNFLTKFLSRFNIHPGKERFKFP